MVIHAATLTATLKLVVPLVEKLIKVVTNAKNKSSEFKSNLGQLESTLKSLVPKIKEIEELNHKFDDYLEKVDISEFVVLLRKGEKLVNRCEQVAWWNLFEIRRYSKELAEFDDSLYRFAQLNLQVEMARVMMMQYNNLNQRFDELMMQYKNLNQRLDEFMLYHKPVGTFFTADIARLAASVFIGAACSAFVSAKAPWILLKGYQVIITVASWVAMSMIALLILGAVMLALVYLAAVYFPASGTNEGEEQGGEAVGFEKPTANVAAINILSIDLKTVELGVEVVAKNPNPNPIPLVGISYLIESNGRKLVSGVIPADECAKIHLHGSETKIKIHQIIINYDDDIKNRYRDIKSGTMIPYKVCLELSINVDVPGIGKITLLPIQKKGEMLPIPHKLCVSVEEEIWHSTDVTHYLKLKNKNDFDLVLNFVDYELWIGTKRSRWAQLAGSAEIQKKAEGVIEVPLIDDEDFGFWNTVGSLFYPFSIKGIIHVDTIFGPMKFPFSRKLGIDLHAEDDTDDED